jgi:hypothetical protein
LKILGRATQGCTISTNCWRLRFVVCFAVGKVSGPFRRSRVGHLWALLISRARVKMKAMGGGTLEDLISKQPLRHANPVAEVAGKLQVWNAIE